MTWASWILGVRDWTRAWRGAAGPTGHKRKLRKDLVRGRKTTETERAIYFSVKDLGMYFKLEMCLKHFEEKTWENIIIVFHLNTLGLRPLFMTRPQLLSQVTMWCVFHTPENLLTEKQTGKEETGWDALGSRCKSHNHQCQVWTTSPLINGLFMQKIFKRH